MFVENKWLFGGEEMDVLSLAADIRTVKIRNLSKKRNFLKPVMKCVVNAESRWFTKLEDMGVFSPARIIPPVKTQNLFPWVLNVRVKIAAAM
jgi:hypothetical protein